MKYIIRIVLLAVALFLAKMLYDSIQEPLIFGEQSTERYQAAQAKMIKIKEAQMAFREGNRRFAKTFDELIKHVDTADFVLTSKRDTSYIVIDKIFKEKVEKFEILTDTLGYSSIKDSLFNSDEELRDMALMPFTDNKKFEMKAGRLKKGSNFFPVLEVKAPKSELLKGLDERYVRMQGQDLILGSMDAVNLNGNW